MVSTINFRSESEWSRWPDLNWRPTHYECVALPLSYSGVANCVRGDFTRNQRILQELFSFKSAFSLSSPAPLFTYILILCY